MKKTIKLIILSFLIGCQIHLQAFDISPEPLPQLLNQVDRNYEIDRQAAYLVTELGGGIYYPEVDAIVPLDPDRIHFEWQKRRNAIANKIGKIHPSAIENCVFNNSATSIDELLADAEKLAPDFRKACVRIAKKTNSVAYFGPGNAYLLKSHRSLERKVTQDALKIGISKMESIAKIGDALRGTIITPNPLDIQKIAKEIKAYLTKKNGKVFFRNYWKEERPSGYVGVHAKMLLPIDGGKRFILAEIQIHLNCIMDGTPNCVKEREHVLYEEGREDHFDPIIMSYASKLLYLTALKKYKVDGYKEARRP